MGVPGSGKDTQAKFLEDEFNFKTIKMGELIRKLSKKDSKLNTIQKHGDLVDEQFVNQIMSHAIDELPDKSIILSDGYPRKLSQAKELEKMCDAKKIDFVKVIYLYISNDEAIKRLKLRSRIDDTSETIHNRLKIFEDTTLAVVDYFKNKSQLTQVDGIGSIEEVWQRVKEAV